VNLVEEGILCEISAICTVNGGMAKDACIGGSGQDETHSCEEKRRIP
jgi:hypothetical protein